ncbi:hypothetical protein [Desulfogranum japonicum]|uniref:hypothetical protein n=1 Tax=Desulfogranum japonicum TaxID=231447 RepID=UPI000404EAAF|nr:hypothetical protein [Desulfogranum japonicum]
MLPEILQSTNLFHTLHQIDIDLAAQQQKPVALFAVEPCIIPTTNASPVEGPIFLQAAAYG